MRLSSGCENGAARTRDGFGGQPRTAYPAFGHDHTTRAGAQALWRRTALEEEIRSAEHTVDRLSRLAGNLLELSRLDAATPDAQSGNAAALESELMDAVDRGRLIAGVSGPEIELATEVTDPLATYGLSVTAFSRILDNLLSNSLQATPQDGMVLLDFVPTCHSIVLAVGDTGHGIPEDFIPHAFERFARPDEAERVIRRQRPWAGAG